MKNARDSGWGVLAKKGWGCGIRIPLPDPVITCKDVIVIDQTVVYNRICQKPAGRNSSVTIKII